jgi:O-antigen ligase
MSATAQPRTIGSHPLVVLGMLIFVIALGIGVILVQQRAVYALFGVMLFAFFLRKPVIGFYATTALLLLSGSSGIVGFLNENATMAVTLAKLCGMAALGAWVINLLVRGLEFKANATVTFILLFLLWALLSTILSGAFVQTWPEWVRLATLVGYFLLGINTINTPHKLHFFIVILLLCGLAMSLVAIAQVLLPQYQVAGAEAWRTLGAVDAAYIDQESLQGEAAVRASGRAGHSNWLAMIILLILPLNSYWYAIAKRPLFKNLIVLMVGIQLTTLVLTYTRTGFLIGIVLALLMLTRRLVRLTPMRIFAVLLALVIAYSLLPNAYKERVFSPKQYTRSESVQARVQLQEAALSYSLHNPLLGLGVGGFGVEFVHENNRTAHIMRYMVNEQFWHPVFIGTHNMYLELTSNTGIPGLIFFVCFYITMMRYLHREEMRYIEEGDTQGEALASALMVSLIGFILCAVFLHALTQKIWWMIAVAAVVLPLYHFNFYGKVAVRDAIPESLKP